MGGFLNMVGLTQQTFMFFVPTKDDQHLGCEMGGTTI